MLASVESESVVTTFYNMDGMKSIFFRAICFFAFEASPPPQKSISMIHFVPLFFGGVALHMITCRAPSRREPWNFVFLASTDKDETKMGSILLLTSIPPVAEANRKEYEDVYTKR